MSERPCSPGFDRGFFVPDDEPDPDEIRRAVGGKIISRRAYADRDAFAAFILQHGRQIVADLKTFLAAEAAKGRRAGTIWSWDKAAHAVAGTRCCRTCGEAKPLVEMKRDAWLCKPCDAARDRGSPTSESRARSRSSAPPPKCKAR